MKTYSDAEVRTALAKLVAESSYRAVGVETGIEFTDLNRMVRGERPVSEKAGLAVGFDPVPRRWTRRHPGGKDRL